MNNLPVHVLADASIAVKLGEASCGEVLESTTRYKERSDTVRDSRGGQNTFVVYGCATNGRGRAGVLCVLFSSALFPPTNFDFRLRVKP